MSGRRFGEVGTHVRPSASLFRRACDVRRALARRECDSWLLACLYSGYNPVPDIDRFIGRGLEMFPRLCCGLATVYLRHCLGEGVITRGWYAASPHTFLVTRGSILDVTADQFGGPEVYVGSLGWPWALAKDRQAGGAVLGILER